MKTINTTTLFILLIFVCTACNFSPKYKRDVTIFEEKKEYKNSSNTKFPAVNLTKWWKSLNDPVTNKLVKNLLAENLSLKEASERIYQAKQVVLVQGAHLLPTGGLTNTASQIKNKGIPKQKLYGTDLAVSWQIDLFGKLRSARNSSYAHFNATKYDMQGLTQSLIAELVSKRISIYLNDRLLKLAQINQQDAEKLYKSVQRRYNLGAQGVKISDTYMAKAHYEDSKQDVSLYKRILTNEIYKLEILLAKMPGTMQKCNLTRKIQIPKLINIASFPVELLDRRPDLRSAELRIVAANADIGVAIADLFPDLMISTRTSYNSPNANKLFSTNNISNSILGKITTKIFAGGALRANIKIQKSKAKELSAKYANKIYKAVGEVESNLQSDRGMISEYTSRRATAKLYQRSKRHSEIRYMRGLEMLNIYLANKRKAYTAEKLLIESERAMHNQRISLYLSLGGDWLGKN